MCMVGTHGVHFRLAQCSSGYPTMVLMFICHTRTLFIDKNMSVLKVKTASENKLMTSDVSPQSLDTV